MMRSRRRLLIALAALALFGAGGAVSTVIYLRAMDPLRRADRLADAGDLRGAQFELRNGLRRDLNNPELHRRMGRLQMKLADPVAAEKEFRIAAARSPDRAAILPELGEAMIAQGKNFETLEEVPPQGPTPAITAKDLLLRAIAQLALKDQPAAAATLAQARRAVPGAMEVPLIEARLAAAHDDAAQTEAKVDEVLRVDPRQIDALLMKQQLLAARGDKAASLPIADRAVESAPWSAMARMARANLLMDAGQDARAQADVESVLDNQPRFTDAIFLHGVLLARRGAYEDAASELARLDFSAQRMPRVLFVQSMVATQLGRTATAAEFARRYNTLVPNDPEGRRLLARALLAINRPQEALTLLDQSVVAGQEDPETLDLLGRANVGIGNIGAAATAFQRAAKVAPDDPNILSHLGLAQMQEGDAADAAATLDRSFGLAPAMHSAGEALVAAYLGLNQVDKAEAALSKLRAETGPTEAVGVLTGMLRLRRLDLDGARDILTETLRTFPASSNVKLNLARVLILQGRPGAGLTMLNEILTKDPANLPALNTYLPLLIQGRQWPAAIQALEGARKADPARPAFTAMLSDALVAIGNPQRGITMLQEARRAAPLPPGLLAALARAQEAAAQPADAESTWRAVLKLAPADDASRGALVDLLLRTGQVDPAKSVLRDAAAERPGDLRVMATLVAVEARANGLDPALRLAGTLRQNPANLPAAAALKGDLYMRAARPADAARAYAEEQAAAPSPTLQLRLAAALAAAGQENEATRQLQAWLKDHPATPDAAQMLAKLDIKAKRLDDAQAHLKLVLDARPNDPLALNNLAWTYVLLGDKRARATAQLAYLQAPTPDAADTLGWIMVQEGAGKAALPLLQQASARRPTDPAMQYHLAVALRDDGRAAEAARILQPIVTGPATFDEKTAARDLLGTLSAKN